MLSLHVSLDFFKKFLYLLKDQIAPKKTYIQKKKKIDLWMTIYYFFFVFSMIYTSFYYAKKNKKIKTTLDGSLIFF
jgi:hypothetical protein